MQVAQQAAPKIPPARVVAAVLKVRRTLVRLLRRSVPAPLMMIDHIYGLIRTQLVYAAARLRLADHLANGPRSAAALAADVGIDAETLHRILRGLASEGIFEMRADGTFALNAAAECLRESSPSSIRNLALFIGAPSHMAAWSRFADAALSGRSGYEVAHGTSLFEYFGAHPEEGAVFAAAMVDATRMDAVGLPEYPVFARATKVCDIGGGRGLLLSRVLGAHPHLRGVLFEKAAVLPGAEAALVANGLAERCERVAGNFLESVPTGSDVYILKNVLHNWDDASCLKILGAVRRSLAPSACLLIVENLIVDQPDQFPKHLIDLQMMVVTGGGKLRTREQWAALLSESGMSVRNVLVLPTQISVIEAAVTPSS